MIINYEEAVRVLRLKFDGDIDHHTCGEIAFRSDEAIMKYLPLKVIFDFEDVRFMDSAGIGMVIGRYKKIMRFGGVAEMVNVGSDVKRIFNMVGIFKIIPLVQNGVALS